MKPRLRLVRLLKRNSTYQQRLTPKPYSIVKVMRQEVKRADSYPDTGPDDSFNEILYFLIQVHVTVLGDPDFCVEPQTPLTCSTVGSSHRCSAPLGGFIDRRASVISIVDHDLSLPGMPAEMRAVLYEQSFGSYIVLFVRATSLTRDPMPLRSMGKAPSGQLQAVTPYNVP